MAQRLGEWQPVEYVGAQDGEDDIWRGHPGRVLDGEVPGGLVTVAWVNGPSTELPAEAVAPITHDEYQSRGRRVASLVHPLREVPIPRFNVAGEEWPDGRRL